jgi:hypothetical protein
MTFGYEFRDSLMHGLPVANPVTVPNVRIGWTLALFL